MGIKITSPTIGDLNLDDLQQGGQALTLATDTRTGGEGVPARLTPLTLQKFTHAFTITQTAHGLVAADLGKPINNGVVLDDADGTHYTTGVLVAIPDANTLQLTRKGMIQFSDLLFEPGYSVAANGPYVYWDASRGLYVSVRPADSATQNVEILFVTNFLPGAAVARVLGWRPVGVE